MKCVFTLKMNKNVSQRIWYSALMSLISLVPTLFLTILNPTRKSRKLSRESN